MALKNNLYSVLFIILLSSPIASAQAKIILPELLAKQAVSNIRFLSQDGKFTYYQKRSGGLFFSSNYKVIEVLKGKLGTQYTLIGSSARKKIAILQDQNFHSLYSVRGNQKIHLIDFGGSTGVEIGDGSNPILHLNDSWVSFYNSNTRVLTFINTTNTVLKFTIKLNNRINPYFSPKVVMSDDNTVYYTDLNETGHAGIFQLKRNTNKTELLFKANTPMVKIEICLNNNHLITGIFGINTSTAGSTITKASLPLADYSKRESIYSSPTNDVGQLICDYDADSITFIKKSKLNEQLTTDIVDLQPSTKEIKVLSEMKTITSVINMDGTLLALDKGKYYIVKGKSDYKNIDTLKSLPPGGASEAIKQLDKQIENE